MKPSSELWICVHLPGKPKSHTLKVEPHKIVILREFVM